MTDITPAINTLLTTKHSTDPVSSAPSTATADEFLKEAYRIVSPIPQTHMNANNKLDWKRIKLTIPELPHLLPPPLPPIHPPLLPNYHPDSPAVTTPTSQPCIYIYIKYQTRTKTAAASNRYPTRHHRLVHRPPPPRPLNLHNKPLLRRVSPPGNPVHASTQEIRRELYLSVAVG